MDYLVPGRECGDCKVCCIVAAIDEPEMQKQPSALCRHRSQSGCDIYEKRPTGCRTYFCGWRRLAFLDDDWRPDKSGVLIESGSAATVGARSMVLFLVGNPLKTLRQQRFLDFVGKSLDQKIIMYIGLPGPRGKVKAALHLNTAQARPAAGRSRSQLRLAVEELVRRLSAHNFVPYPMKNGGNDVST